MSATTNKSTFLGMPAYLLVLAAVVLVGLAIAGVVLLLVLDNEDNSYRTDADTEDFDAFADRVATAADRGDIAFITDRVVGTTHVCTAQEVAASQDDPTAICAEVGQEFQSAVINGYGSQGSVTTADGVKDEITALFEQSLPSQEDSIGGGKARVYATAVDDDLQLPNRPTNTVLITSLVNVGGVAGRTVVGVDFTWNGEQWVIESILTANFPIASELLDATQAKAVYEQWEAYE